ncbi:MAG TPA: ADOP family duplicated permease [Vicinamibacterales bacterium]|nr:ADOP family duplicated permease [Vicinamibacterales bacterium]
MDTLIRDVRHALAVLRRDPLFSAAALLALALGIGATTAVFSVIYGVLLRPLPYQAPDRLVRVYEEHPGAPKPPGEQQLSNTTLYAWQPRMHTLEGLAPYYAQESSVSFGTEPIRLHAASVGASVFTLLRATPAAGRFFTKSENAAGNDLVVVVSERLWRERLHSDPRAVGGLLQVDGSPHTIVGVARPDFHFPDQDTLLWIPYVDPTRADPRIQGGVWLSSAIGRLSDGASPAQAAAEGTGAARSIPRAAVLDLLFGTGAPVEVRVEPLAAQMTSGIRGVLLVVGGSVVFFLVIACANVANLFLSRGVARQREFALRTALGAARSRLIRQLLTESAVLTTAGAAIALGLAWLLVRGVIALAPPDFPRLHDVRIDGRVLGFSLAVTMLTAVVTGLMPALRGTSFALAPSLHGGDGGVAGGFRGVRARRWRDALLAAEAALAVLTVVGAALFTRSFITLVRVDAGYTPENVVIAQLFPRPDVSRDTQVRLIDALMQRLRQDGRVSSAGIANMMPFSDSTIIAAFDMPPLPGMPGPIKAHSFFYRVTPGYAEALGLRLHAGRLLRDGDETPDRMRIVVNEEFARRYCGRGAVVGRIFSGGPAGPGRLTEIVGVVGNVLKDGKDARPEPELYTAVLPKGPLANEIDVVVRTKGDPARYASALAAMVRSVDPDTALGPTMPLTRRIEASVAQPRFVAAVLGMFALLSLALASLGLYSVLSYGVSQRHRELSVRAALGAARADLIALVLREGLAVTIAGVAAGLGCAMLLSRLVRGLLFGITPLDWPAYAAAPIVLLPVAVLACLLPAVRAASAEPATVLRGER